MDVTNVYQGINDFSSSVTGKSVEALTGLQMGVALALIGCIVVGYIVQAVLVGALARSKGYSFAGNFVLGLFFGTFALIYEAGRPVSYERECVMQDRLALQMAKEMFKLQRAREKANAQRGIGGDE